MNSAVIGGVSMSWNAMSSYAIMPGTGSRVVKGKSPTSGVALVSALSRLDLPALGAPTSAAWPPPSGNMRKLGPLRPLIFAFSHSSTSSERLRLRSASM